MATQTITAIESRQEAVAPAAAPKRYLALDAYRGFTMFVLVSSGFGLRSAGPKPARFHLDR